ncbi:hypothetical protein D6D01_10295, partial [Aureobasidium pullulans]
GIDAFTTITHFSWLRTFWSTLIVTRSILSTSREMRIEKRTIANIVCCEKCWNYPHMEDGIDCDDLGTTLSVKMSSLGGVILHELVHFDPMCVPSIGQQTEDIAWGPLSVRKLRQNEPENACLNADNYKWYARHLWWTVICNRRFSAPRGKIDTYEP